MFNSLFGNLETPQQRIAVIVVGIWTLVWKGLALWHAARREKKVWFVVLLVLNTMGILEIVYLLIFNKRGKANLTTIRESRKDEPRSLPRPSHRKK